LIRVIGGKWAGGKTEGQMAPALNEHTIAS
jgi:hypothetical protein